MSARLGRLGLAAGPLVVLAGCATASYLSSAYIGVPPQIVTTGCKDTYEVYDKRQAGKLLVVSNVLRELAECDGSGRDRGKLARFEETARVYFAEIRRAECRIVTAAALSPLHAEFTYACEGGADAVRGRGLGRG